MAFRPFLKMRLLFCLDRNGKKEGCGNASWMGSGFKRIGKECVVPYILFQKMSVLFICSFHLICHTLFSKDLKVRTILYSILNSTK